MPRPHQEVTVTEACVPNIGARGRTRRFAGGIVWLLITVANFAALAKRGAPTAMFLIVAPFAAIAAVYFFQAKEKT